MKNNNHTDTDSSFDLSRRPAIQHHVAVEIFDGYVAKAVRRFPFPWVAKPIEDAKGDESRFGLFDAEGKTLVILCKGDNLAEARESAVQIRQRYEQSLE